MYDHRLYVKSLSEFTRVLLMPYDVHAALSELTSRVTDILDLAGCGVSLARGDRLEFENAGDDAIMEIERVQERLQVGPCVTAHQSGRVVAVSDLSAHVGQWPDYCGAAARRGINAVASLPMQMAPLSVGALNLYARSERDWPDDDLAAASAMADLATVFLVNASHAHKQRELADQLQQALDSRVTIEQAKGVLAGRHGLTPEEAFNRIRAYARRHNKTVRAVAHAVLDRSLDPGPGSTTETV